MRAFPLVLAISVAASAVLATAALAVDQKPPAKPASRPAAGTNAPKPIGKFDDWQAATHLEAGQTVCYAFTRAQSSTPAITGRSDVILTVTQRPPNGRDAVAITAGFTYASGASVAVQAETSSMDFYTAGRSAFARDGAAAVAAFQKARQVLARSPNPKGVSTAATVTDQFSLKGFAAAYAAIVKACPPK